MLKVNVTLKLLLSDGVIEILESRGGGVGGPFTLLKLKVFGGCGLRLGRSLNAFVCDVLLQSLEPLEILLTPKVKGSLTTGVVGNLKVLVFPMTGLDSLQEKLFEVDGLNICCVLFSEKLLIVEIVSEMGDKQFISLLSIVLSVFELNMVKPMPLLELQSGDLISLLVRIFFGDAMLLCQNSCPNKAKDDSCCLLLISLRDLGRLS